MRTGWMATGALVLLATIGTAEAAPQNGAATTHGPASGPGENGVVKPPPAVDTTMPVMKPPATVDPAMPVVKPYRDTSRTKIVRPDKAVPRGTVVVPK